MPALHHSIFYRLDALPAEQTGFTFLVPAHPGSPGQRAVNRVCVTENSICLVVVSFVVVFITAACEDTHNPRSTRSPAVLTISHCLRVLLTGVRPAVTQSPCSNSDSYRKKTVTASLLPSATDATTSLKSFSDSASRLGLNISWQNYRTLVPVLNHQIFPWTVIQSNQSTALFTLTVYNHWMVNVVQTQHAV